MSLTAFAMKLQLLAPNVPNPDAQPLPDKINSAFDKVIGMGITLGAAVAVACLIGAGLTLMFAETGHGSPGAKFVKILGGLGVVLGAGSIVGFIVT